MKLSRASVQAVVLLGGALCLRTTLHAQEAAPPASNPDAPPEDEIIVQGKPLEEIRLRIERAENDVYTRFNEINSDDSYDIHCYERPPTNSHILKRVCMSNAARAADVAIAQATVFALQGPTVAGAGGTSAGVSAAPGGATAIAQIQHAKQLDTERRVQEELRRLAQEDPVLKAEVAQLGEAYRARDTVAGAPPGETLYAELEAGGAASYDAQHVFEVRVGDVAWKHALTSRTFTVAKVQGRIRELHIDCDKTTKALDYKADAEWTVPESWGECTLEVSARRGTTFALYEFD
jgi:hypothetical protein